MQNVKSIFVETAPPLDIATLKSGCLSRHFKASTNTILCFLNNQKINELTFIFEKKCEKESLLILSRLFLMIVQKNILKPVRISGHILHFGPYAKSRYHHYVSSKSAIFCHAFKWKQIDPKSNEFGHPDFIKSFSITILNEFKFLVEDIFKKVEII